MNIYIYPTQLLTIECHEHCDLILAIYEEELEVASAVLVPHHHRQDVVEARVCYE
jgi:hypothetical protein